MNKKLHIFYDNPVHQNKAELIKKYLTDYEYTILDKSPDYILHVNEMLTLKDSEGRKLQINPLDNKLDYQRKNKGGGELIAKALGYKKGIRKVLDLSVGMGVDFCFLKQLGFEVIGVERNPILYLLLKEAFGEELIKHSSAQNFLQKNKGQWKIDAIYFDPMYPAKKKTSLPKQEMVLFRGLVGDDHDSDEVISEALKWFEYGLKRIVIKRPLKAEALKVDPSSKRSIIKFEGKLIRYDVIC